MDVVNAGWSKRIVNAPGNSPLFEENLFDQIPKKDPTSSIMNPAGIKSTGEIDSLSPDFEVQRSSRLTDDGLYTPMDQLSKSDLEQFKAATFTLDKLPLVPPPRELC